MATKQQPLPLVTSLRAARLLRGRVMTIRCAVIYAGKSFPDLRGACCLLPAGHSARHHSVASDGRPLSWWTEAEKIEVRRRAR